MLDKTMGMKVGVIATIVVGKREGGCDAQKMHSELRVKVWPMSAGPFVGVRQAYPDACRCPSPGRRVSWAW